MCPGALPEPGQHPPRSLATAPHPGNLSTNHITSSLDCCRDLLQARTVPLNTAVTPLFLCFKPPVSLSAFLWGVQMPEQELRTCASLQPHPCRLWWAWRLLWLLKCCVCVHLRTCSGLTPKPRALHGPRLPLSLPAASWGLADFPLHLTSSKMSLMTPTLQVQIS